MLEDHLAGGQPFGARGADVVGAQDFDHAGAYQPHEGRRHVIAQRDGGHHEVLPAAAARDGQHAQRDREQHDEDEGEEKVGQRLAQHRHRQAQPVDEAALVESGQHAQRDGDQQGDRQRSQAQQQRGLQLGPDQRSHLGLEIYRGAEVALQDMPEPVGILHQHGPVQAVGAAHRVDIRLARPFAGQGQRRVARQMQQQKRQHRYGQGHQQGQPQASERESQHVFPLCLCRLLPAHVPEAGELVRIGLEGRSLLAT